VADLSSFYQNLSFSDYSTEKSEQIGTLEITFQCIEALQAVLKKKPSIADSQDGD
jgi:hypothetical protein